MVDIESPRVLRLTFELHVPKGLRRNVQWPRVEAAINAFTEVVQGAATTAFPWATKMRVTREWLYVWHHSEGSTELPETEQNAGPYDLPQDGSA